MAIHKGKNSGSVGHSFQDVVGKGIEAAKYPKHISNVEKGQWPTYTFRPKGIFWSAVVEAEEQLQVSHEMVLLPALGAMSTVLQGSINVELPTRHEVNTSLMLLTLAESGERKTTVQNQFFSSIKKFNEQAVIDGEANEENFQVENELWKENVKAYDSEWKKAVKKGNEEEIEKADKKRKEIRRKKPDLPSSNRILYDDTTPQALVQGMHKSSRYACLATSEANSIFSGYVFRDLDKINTLWDGGNVIVDRNTKPSFILSNSRLTLALMTQPSVVKNFLSKRGEEARGMGFLARFLVVKPRSTIGQKDPKEIGKLLHLEKFNKRALELLEGSFERLEKEEEMTVVRFSARAKMRWNHLFKEVEEKQLPNQVYEHYADHAAKLMDNVSRVAALIHVFDNNEGDIDVDTLDYSYHICRLFSWHFQKYLAGVPQVVKDANSIAALILECHDKEVRSEKRIYSNAKLVDVARFSVQMYTYNVYGGASTYTGMHGEEYLKYRLPGILGRSYYFKISFLKQYARPASLRNNGERERLHAALQLLKNVGHLIEKDKGYEFRETLFSGSDGPPLKNGQDVTVDALPLFTDQTYHPELNNTFHKWLINK